MAEGEKMAEILKTTLQAIEKFEGKLDGLPCMDHLASIVQLKEMFQRMDSTLSKLVDLLENGKGGLVTSVRLLEQRLQHLESWRGNVLSEQQRSKERLEYVTLRNRWQLVFVFISPAAASLITWLLTR